MCGRRCNGKERRGFFRSILHNAAAKRQAKAAVEMAKSNVNTYDLNEQQKKNLHDKKIISDFEYQSAVDQLLSAKASLAQAEAQRPAPQNLGFLYSDKSFRWRGGYIPLSYW